eukprot:TRINITY_DN55021_c0_g1_i1.p2 TRINITY_DN55021_c0_g1~~TRINITY_DN55021_c0_g1_i1.p2  ORF type:complete len:360 (+),score=125.76 TRINITY_DN55021_c0_g1_i1:86-1081(+)
MAQSDARVFVTRRLPAAGLDKVLAAFPKAKVWDGELPPPREVLLREVRGCHGLVTLLTDPIDKEVLAAAGPQLKVVSNFAVGYNNIDLAEAARRGVLVGNTPGVLTDATADMALTLMMAAGRRLGEAQTDARAGKWRTWEPLGYIGQDFKGKTLGVVGMGRIGTALAERCHGAWGMKVIYSNIIDNKDANARLGARRVELPELLREADFISVHTDLNPDTKGMFNRNAFRQMKRTCVFVNTARGPIVNHDDLCDALRSGTIAAAGLDVTDPEPFPVSHGLYSCPQCIIAPHIASATTQTRNAMASIAADNLIAGIRGAPLRHAVPLPKARL